MTNDTVKIGYSIRTNKIGSECKGVVEVSREEWDSMTDDQKEALMREHAFEYIEWNWKEVT